MAQDSVTTLHGLLDVLLPIFELVELPSSQLQQSLAALRKTNRTDSVESASGDSWDDKSRRDILHSLAVCLNESRVQRSPRLAEAFRILADISRDRECLFPTKSTLVADLQ
jgi:hypothetical protein